MPRAGDETWRRLLEWTSGQTPSERLAAQVLRGEGYQGIDPSHPLGGPDGGRDAVASKAGKRWIMAVYFPRGRESFGAIRKKFLDDLVAASKHKPDGLVFVTNQELTLSERSELSGAAGNVDVDIYHLERLASILDSAAYYGARLEYLGIPMTMEEQLGFFKSLQDASSANFAELRGLIDGGDTFCYLALYHFDMENGFARQVMLVKKGRFALKDLSLRATELSVSPGPLTVQMGARSIFIQVGMRIPARSGQPFRSTGAAVPMAPGHPFR